MKNEEVTITNDTQQVIAVKMVTIGNDISPDPIISSTELGKSLCDYIGADASETMVVLFLDTKLHVNVYRRVFSGTVNASLVSPREIMQTALLCNASSIIIAHNHPSCNPQPSRADEDTCEEIALACQVMGIRLLDNLIVTPHNYFSFREDGLL
ncbi:JAB domain-containing protein [Lacticaseibacillus sharpeae]|uniref:JAB domain-containing protein n=1 Tax=Lacticaseibacillus sharpeae TaxID=1626 RepID=UPI0006D28D16|nr:JAB domain-containing protein [Lacticaseibacillus sharpeae]